MGEEWGYLEEFMDTPEGDDLYDEAVVDEVAFFSRVIPAAEARVWFLAGAPQAITLTGRSPPEAVIMTGVEVKWPSGWMGARSSS